TTSPERITGSSGRSKAPAPVAVVRRSNAVRKTRMNASRSLMDQSLLGGAAPLHKDPARAGIFGRVGARTLPRGQGGSKGEVSEAIPAWAWRAPTDGMHEAPA